MTAIQAPATPTMTRAPANPVATLVATQADNSATTRVDTLATSEANTYTTVYARTAEQWHLCVIMDISPV